ncbi:MAG: hypothetical protein ACI4RI_03200 [Ruminococcus sp.]
MLYNICGLNVQYTAKYPRTLSRSEKYIADDQTLTPDITLDVTEERIDNYISIYPQVSRSLAEYVIFGASFYEAVLDFDAILLHSSAIAVDNKAYLFTADSGTGKSTHTKLWMDYFGDRAVMINDDKPAIRIIDEKIYACGTPFSGKHDINSNVLIPLRGICCLNQGEENHIEKISNREAIQKLMQQTLLVPHRTGVNNLLNVLDRVIKSVDVYKLYCDISEDAVLTSYNGMK